VQEDARSRREVREIAGREVKPQATAADTRGDAMMAGEGAFLADRRKSGKCSRGSALQATTPVVRDTPKMADREYVQSV
jgi:hypothetical protein